MLPGKQRCTRSRARVSCGVVVTRTTECQWSRRARRPVNSASPRVVAGSGQKQITLTPGICGAQLLPLAQYGEPREITTTGARCAQARLRAVGRRSPGPLSITMALTWPGIPRSGHTNRRAVAAPNTGHQEGRRGYEEPPPRGRPGPAVRGFWAVRSLANGRPS